MSDDLPLREATPADIPVLVNHRRRMSEDIAVMADERHEPRDLDRMDSAYGEHLRTHLDDGSLRAWVIESDGRIVASGAVSFFSWLPRPRDSTERLAYLHSMYTEPEYRRRGLARRIVQAAIDACRAAGMHRLTLHASEAGRSVYQSLGFLPTNEMRLTLT
ncbi:MAG TPA: GNAT family N-acetyltransferase [Anaerolineae bacterium]